MKSWTWHLFLLAAALPLLPSRALGGPHSVPEGIRVRTGYELTVAQDTIQRPRLLALGPDSVLYVSLPDAGEIKACRDTDKDGYYETVATFVSGRGTAHGLCWHDGWLWFTQSQVIARARDTDGDGKADEVMQILGEDVLPGGTGHWWRPILIHEGRIYTGVGDPGNITDQTGTKREKLYSYNLEGKDERLFISGIRNTEKLVVRPGTDEIWGMDHGSDNFGRTLGEQPGKKQPITDWNPPCEMNHYIEGGFYGHPFLVGNRVPRPEFIGRKDIVDLAAKTTPPEWCCGAHWAPNAMTFCNAEQLPGHKGDAFVAYHGSWNRLHKAGYCVTRVLFENGHPYGELPYVEFLTKDEKVLGRPVDVIVAFDGSLLISDDHRGRIYRLRCVKKP
jgi:glucose/arabinose dehydrogenase